MRFKVNRGLRKYSDEKSDILSQKTTDTSVSASKISLKSINKKSLNFKMYEESDLSYFDSELGAQLQHKLIFQKEDEDCASDDEGVDYAKNSALKSLIYSINKFNQKDKSFVENYKEYVE